MSAASPANSNAAHSETVLHLQQAFKLALSLTLFYWLALWTNWDVPQYGVLAIAVISLDTLGQQAGIKQGHATLAYRRREELFMTVILTRMKEWYDGLESSLRSSADPLSLEEAAVLVASSLAERPEPKTVCGRVENF